MKQLFVYIASPYSIGDKLTNVRASLFQKQIKPNKTNQGDHHE